MQKNVKKTWLPLAIDLWYAYCFVPGVVATIATFFGFTFTWNAIIYITFATITVYFILHIRRLHKRLNIREKKRERNRSENTEEIYSALSQFIQFMKSLLYDFNEEIMMREFQKHNPQSQIRIIKIIFSWKVRTVIVSTKTLRKLGKGLKFRIFQVDSTGVERNMGVASISHVQPNGISQAQVIHLEEQVLWDAYILECNQTSGYIRKGEMILRPINNEKLTNIDLSELVGAKKVLDILLSKTIG